METFLVAGAAGFIGANFVRAVLRREDRAVVALDRLTYAGHRESLSGIPPGPRFRLVEGDLADRDLVLGLLREHRPRYLVNLAAESHVDRSIDGPAAFVHSNTVAVFEMLEAVRSHLAGLPESARRRFRLLQVSTDEVYGDARGGPPFREETPVAPRSPYSATKAAGDHLVQAWHATYGLPVLLTRCSNNYGPFQFPEKLIPLALLNALEGRPLPIYGDGLQVRDWIFVEDHCEALLTVLERAEPGSRYNIGAREERTNLEMVELLCRVLEERLPAADCEALRRQGLSSYRSLIRFVTDRPGHDRRYAIDPGRIERELGWRPRHDLPSGLARTVDWYLAHRAWCESVQGSYRRERLGLAGGAGRGPG